jgi:phenylalanyl-tRNA synthetase alpha chain
MLNKLIETLHPLERKVLPFLKESASFPEIVKLTNLQEVEVMRALQWLENKNIIKINKKINKIISLDNNGLIYIKKGLPERRFLQVLEQELTLNEIKQKALLNDNELQISLGILKKKAAIILDNNKIKITQNGKTLLNKELLEEQFLKKLPLNLNNLKDEDKYSFNELKSRKEIIKINEEKIITIDILTLGHSLIQSKIETNFIDSLTPEIIKNQQWKNKKFRRYDVKINVPKIYPAKRHFVNEAIKYIKQIWLDLGFQEMKGTMIQTSFWNFDALFTAQDHPVRDLQDTFFIKDPSKGKLPKELVNRIKSAHENGYKTGSKGWQYFWNLEEAKKNCLRTHTTVLSARTISKLKKTDLPAKFFSVGKCFRNETLDWAHLHELIQVEGIVVDENVNLRHLIGYLKEFFRKMGFEKVRVRPAYFPYTSNSAEVDIFHPIKKKWIELGGSGIFRPEVTFPLFGKEIPVLAWGLGLERTISEYYNIYDIRDLYKNDLQQLKQIKLWLK